VGSIGTILLVVGLIGYGVVEVEIIKPRQPVAIVDDQEISRREFHTRLRFMLSAGTDPISVGYRILNEMVDELIIKQEANRLGIVVSEEEIEAEIERRFGFFPEGTPTPIPTRTPDPTSLAQATATSTPTSGPTPTVEPSSTPRPSATPYTREAYEETRAEYFDNLSELFNATEEDYISILEAQILRERLLETFEDDVERVQEQVWLRHIRVTDREIIDEIIARLDADENWDDLAAELSEDTLSKDSGGDLGWLTWDNVTERFGEEAVQIFQAPINELLEPIQTSFGWHLIQVLDRGERSLDEEAFQQAVRNEFSDWLTSQRDIHDVVIMDDWIEDLPQPPAVP
jgi:parvulin-like peptidyl-prolyl isomerase